MKRTKEPKWVNARNNKRCPVCKFDKVYAGVICPSCSDRSIVHTRPRPPTNPPEPIKLPTWVNARNNKRCPVCKFDKVYAGVICPSCLKLGYRVDPNGRIKRDAKNN